MDAEKSLKKIRIIFSACAISMVIGVGCVRHVAPETGPLDPLVASAHLQSQAASISQLAVDAQVDVNKFGITWASVNTIVLVRRPGDMRLELLSPTDELLSILTLDEKGFVMHERGSDVCHVGLPCAMEQVRLLPIPIAAESLIDVLLGGAGLSPDSRFGPVIWDERQGEYRVRVEAGNDARTLHLDPCSHSLRSVHWESEGGRGPVLRVKGWQAATGAQVPARLEIEVPSEGVSLDVTYRVVDREMEMDGQAFRFTCPRGTEVRTHRCVQGGSE
jgi:outer membrane lipoprotein-sorting protein